MAFITYNQNEAIFLGLFFSLLIATFIFIFAYPPSINVLAHQKDMEKDLNTYEMKKVNKKGKTNKVAKIPSKKSKNVLETKF
jgi:hypothetical protein